jgi:hypothetical protein
MQYASPASSCVARKIHAPASISEMSTLAAVASACSSRMCEDAFVCNGGGLFFAYLCLDSAEQVSITRSIKIQILCQQETGLVA